jgi:RHS repeat-associated protein
LATVAETQYGQTTPDWRQQFGYDRYGNRAMGTGSTQTFGRNSTETQALIGPDPTVSTSTNRITNKTGEHYEFDASGNMTKDALGNRSVYDIENHQTEYYYSTNAGSIPDATYFYDGDGKRIKKVVGTETTVFVYDTGGKLTAEYTLGVTANPSPQTNYLTTDTLGSTRLVTNGAGQVVARHDYLPFGDEIYGLGGRTAAQGFGQPDTTRQRFTGYEHDPESGLDFAESRYYHHGLGRFTSADPLNIILGRQSAGGSKESENEFRFYLIIPQQWNKFIYCVDNPLRYVDPDGYDPTVVYLNIIFDQNSHYSMEEKQEIMRQYFEQTKKDFANIDITFWVDQRDGSAAATGDETRHIITLGEVPGAINAFFTRNAVTTVGPSEVSDYSTSITWISTGDHIGDKPTSNLTHGILHVLGLAAGANGFPGGKWEGNRIKYLAKQVFQGSQSAEWAVESMQAHLTKLSNGGYHPIPILMSPMHTPLISIGKEPDKSKEVNILKKEAKRYEHKR